MIKLPELLKEVSKLEDAMSKVASKKIETKQPSRLEQIADSLSKLAECVEGGSSSEEEMSEEEKEKAKEEEKKEASMKFTPEQLKQLRSLIKEAVASGPNMQGSVVNEGPQNDGTLVDTARAFDEQRLKSDAEVNSDIAANPEKNAPEGGDNTIEGAPLNNVGDRPPALGGVGGDKAASVVLTAEQAETLDKLATIGYWACVDHQSDLIVQEKVASAYLAQQAAEAPAKIAAALRQREAAPAEKTASTKQVIMQKLAHLQQNDPELFNVYATLAKRGML